MTLTSTSNLNFRAEVLKRLNTPGAVRPLSQSALKLMESLRMPESNVLDIVGLIESDPGLAVRSMALANSPLYGHSREINSVRQAVVIIGRSALAQMAATYATQQLFCDDASGNTMIMQLQAELFHHSLGCGAVARALVEHLSDVDDDEAYLSAILHDIGKLVLMQCDPAVYECIVHQSSTEPIWRLEHERLGITHQEVGALCSQSWGLPESIVLAIKHHHDNPNEVQHPEIVALVSAANQLAHHWNLGDHRTGQKPEGDVDGTFPDEFPVIGISSEHIRLSRAVAHQYYDELLQTCGTG